MFYGNYIVIVVNTFVHNGHVTGRIVKSEPRWPIMGTVLLLMAKSIFMYILSQYFSERQLPLQ